jgi:hypothetical protein
LKTLSLLPRIKLGKFPTTREELISDKIYTEEAVVGDSVLALGADGALSGV